jgi:hypothetical protein
MSLLCEVGEGRCLAQRFLIEHTFAATGWVVEASRVASNTFKKDNVQANLYAS